LALAAFIADADMAEIEQTDDRNDSLSQLTNEQRHVGCDFRTQRASCDRRRRSLRISRLLRFAGNPLMIAILLLAGPASPTDHGYGRNGFGQNHASRDGPGADRSRETVDFVAVPVMRARRSASKPPQPWRIFLQVITGARCRS
jgi:hypothetical protein